MMYKNLTIIGTSHIAAESVAKVERTILKEQPAIVALELDRKRLMALLHPQKAVSYTHLTLPTIYSV